MVLNPAADRAICKVLSILLAKLTILGRMKFHRLLQISNDLSIAEHRISQNYTRKGNTLISLDLASFGLSVIALSTSSGQTIQSPDDEQMLNEGDKLILYGLDKNHEHFEMDLS